MTLSVVMQSQHKGCSWNNMASVKALSQTFRGISIGSNPSGLDNEQGRYESDLGALRLIQCDLSSDHALASLQRSAGSNRQRELTIMKVCLASAAVLQQHLTLFHCGVVSACARPAAQCLVDLKCGVCVCAPHALKCLGKTVDTQTFTQVACAYRLYHNL